MSNRYDEVYNYRLATISDTASIMDFIRCEWGANHILGHDKELFIWQYGRKEYGDEDGLNFVLMTDKEDKILGIIGFVAYNEANEDISPAMTKVMPEGLLPMSGLEFMKRQMMLIGEKRHFASGTNSKTILPLYQRVFRHNTGIMQQYYMINPDQSDFSLVKLEKEEKPLDYDHTGFSLKEVKDYQELYRQYDLNENNEHMPRKSPEFIKKRYFEHPIYEYKKWIVKNSDDKALGVLFGREIELDKTKVLRIVDYRGDLEHLSKLGDALHELLRFEKYEYLDLVVSDLSDYHMEGAGFRLLDPDGETIIPNYFEPFVLANIKNYYQNNSDIVIFKADGDQDRPNHR